MQPTFGFCSHFVPTTALAEGTFLFFPWCIRTLYCIISTAPSIPELIRLGQDYDNQKVLPIISSAFFLLFGKESGSCLRPGQQLSVWGARVQLPRPRAAQATGDHRGRPSEAGATGVDLGTPNAGGPGAPRDTASALLHHRHSTRRTGGIYGLV